MGRVLTNNISLAYAIETPGTIGTLPGSPVWNLLEPNDITTFGAALTRVERTPLSKNRQRKKGTVVDLDSEAGFDHDLTVDAALDFVEGFCFAQAVGLNLTSGDDALSAQDATPGDEGFAYTSITGSALIDGHLVYTQDFANAANNGLFVVDGANSTDALVAVAGTPGLVDESPSVVLKARLQVAGWRFTDNSVGIVVSGSTATLTRASGSQDYTTIGLTPGQFVHVGGLTAGRQFGLGAGYGRVVSVSATVIVLDKIDSTLATDTGADDTVDLLFGPFVRNVQVDDDDYITRSFQFEATFPNLGSAGASEFEYAAGNLCNEMAVSLPLTDKATVAFGFIGTNSEPITATRKTNAATPSEPNQTVAFGTSSDIARITFQKKSDGTDLGAACFKNLTVTLRNNVGPEKCLGTLGAVEMNVGNFEVDLDGQLLFTTKEAANAIRNNETISLDFRVKNDDGAIFFDVPSMTAGGGDKEYPVNESVLINEEGTAFEDDTLGTSIGISFFPTIP